MKREHGRAGDGWRARVALWLVLAFVGIGPTASLRPCPVHTGGHHSAGHGAAGTAGTAHTAGQGEGHHDPAAGESDGTDSTVPCDCLGLCLTCAVALPIASGPPDPDAGLTVSPAPAVLGSLIHGDPATYLIPLAKPPPA